MINTHYSTSALKKCTAWISPVQGFHGTTVTLSVSGRSSRHHCSASSHNEVTKLCCPSIR